MRTRLRALVGAGVLLFGASAVLLGTSGAHAANGCQTLPGGFVCYEASGQDGICVKGLEGGTFFFAGVDCSFDSLTGAIVENLNPALSARALVVCNTFGSPPTWTIVVFVDQVGTPVDTSVHC